MLTELPVQLSVIKHKIQQLLKQQQHLEKENRQLREALEKKDQQLQQSHGQSARLEEQLTALRLNQQRQLSPEDRLEVQQKIDSYLKEIDRCIALLST
jgi:hypothetical protein